MNFYGTDVNAQHKGWSRQREIFPKKLPLGMGYNSFFSYLCSDILYKDHIKDILA